jgi:hypothetical protein
MKSRFVLFVVVASTFLGPSVLVAQHDKDVQVGAIRWDAWTGDLGPGAAVEKSLGPAKWHYRLPFFAKVIGPDKVLIDGTSQEVMDEEIDYAARAGLDYWAFVLYEADSSMSIAISRYLSSTKRSKIKFGLVTETGDWSNPEMVSRMESLLTEKGYVTVLGGHPVIYILTNSKQISDSCGGNDLCFQAGVKKFRTDLRNRSLKNPYIVIMDFDAADGKRLLDRVHADAISSYTTQGNAPEGSSFAVKAAAQQWFWNQCKETGAQVVPIVSLGAGRAPRIENPVPWEKWQKQGVGNLADNPPAPKQITELFISALSWLKDNRESAKAQLIITYAWNENDEGGWLVPTLSEGTARIDAASAALKTKSDR